MNRFLWQQVNVTYKRLRRSFISIVVIVILILRIQNAARSQAQIRRTQDKMSQTLANKNMFSVEGAYLIVRGILFHSSAAHTAATARSPLCLNLGRRSLGRIGNGQKIVKMLSTLVPSSPTQSCCFF